MDIVLSYPFSGSLYAFFTEQARGEKVPDKVGHRYYQTLYGKKHSEVRDLALTNLLLYENVFIVAADNHMPETDKYYDNGVYKNIELGLFSEWPTDHFREQIDVQIEKDLADPVISKILFKVPQYSKKQILRDCRNEIALANKYSCPVLASGGRSVLIKRLSEIDSAAIGISQVRAGTVVATEEYVNIVCLNFNPTDYDLLYSYKQDKDLRVYAAAFQKIIRDIDNPMEARKKLLTLIRESMEKQSLMKISSSFLDVSSIILSLTGFIPGIGIFLSGGSLAATGGSKLLAQQASRKWYEFGPQINRIKDRKLLERQIEKELDNT
ncbi:MAG: hypothetical protein ABSE95_04555 [Thermodesulfobacteriota bacterium]|jgi:hypothetical protein